MYLERIFNTLFYTLMIGTGLVLLLSMVSHFFVFPYAILWMYRTFLVSCGIGLLLGGLQYPTMLNVIEQSDRLGAKERLQTSWEFSNNNSVESQLQRQETIEFLQSVFIQFRYKMKLKYKPLLISCGFIIVATGLVFVPSKAKETADAQELFQKEIIASEKELIKEKDQLLEKYPLSEEDKAKLESTLEPLLEKLKEATTEEEALKQLSIAKDEIKKLELDRDQEVLTSLADATKQIAELEKKEAQSMGSEDRKALNDSIENLMKQLNENAKRITDSSTKEQVKEALASLEEQLKAAAEVESNSSEQKEASDKASLSADALAELLKNLSENNAGSHVSQALQSAINSMANSVSTDPSISDLAFNAQNQSGNSSTNTNSNSGTTASGSSSQSEGSSGSSQAGESSQSGENGQSGESSQSGQSGESSQQGQNGESESGSGTGSGQGSGTGEGSGTGQGNGNGTGNGQGSGTGNGTGSGQGRGTGSVDSSLYSPSRLGGSSEPTYVNGIRNQSGETSTQQANDKPLETGSLISYDELYRDYYDQAQKNMSSLDVPLVMKDIIIEYFTTIQ